MQQEVVLAMLAKEPSHGYELRGRLRARARPARGGDERRPDLRRADPSGKSGPGDLGARSRVGGPQGVRAGPAGQERVAEWLAEVSWPKPDLAEFHLKLVAAAAAGLADPLTIVDAQRRELLRRLRDAQRAAMAEPDDSDAALLLRGRRAPPASGPALAGGVRAEMDRAKECIVSDDTSRAARLRAAQGVRPRRRAGARRRRGRSRCRIG